MQYDFITFDTQTVETDAFHFDGGLLSQLKQFKDGPVRVVVSEIVVREVFKHLVEKTRAARDSAASAHKQAVDHGLANADVPFVAGDVDLRAVARTRLNKVLQEIGAQIVRANNVPMSDLVDAYFQPAPPFSAAGKNKAEFPNAIALLSLERWAKEGNFKVLGVSKDKGWKAFAELSDRLDLYDELTNALSLLQKHAEEARAVVQQMLTSIDTNSDQQLATRFEMLLANEVSGYSVYAEADSFYTAAEADQVHLNLVDFRFVGDEDEFDFSVIQSGPNMLVAQVEIETSIKAEASFHMSIYYDSIDKDYTPAGFKTACTDEEVTLKILATFEREQAPASFEITKLEIVDGPRSINFGFVEPDYEPKPEENYQLPDDSPDGRDEVPLLASSPSPH
jgi:hypothetical protein